MNLSSPVTSPSARPRSLFVTMLAWLMIALSAGFSLVSVVALLMILAGSDGTSTSDPLGFLVVVVAPPVTFAAGVGLLFRASWARLYVLALLLVVVAYNVQQFLRGPLPRTSYVSAAGVPTTVLESEPFYSIPLVVVCVFLMAMLVSRRVRMEFATPQAPHIASAGPRESAGHEPVSKAAAPAEAQRGWRVGHRGRDCIYYEELQSGEWRRIDISGEMLTGPAHHVIYFPSPQAWKAHPEWVRDRREEIIARIRSEFREPEYEYGSDVTPSATSIAPAPGMRRLDEGKSGYRLLALGILLATSGIMFWLVETGIHDGTTQLPIRHVAGRTVSRADDPAMFWVSIGLYAAVGAGTLGLAAWGVREAMRSRK
jgi:hypothetical protein